ncbi:MAG: peptidylprolyl isomerase [Candidatus Altiarchaeota archaeon]|nr:peptidylprolyl isomerase [Candidatus Altiarchaeota archaeon]
MEVRASHILVGSEEQAKDILNKINSGDDFAEAAKKYSKCPSGAKGGDLGFFGRGRMVKEFDKFCFSHKKDDVGVIKTEFGWHVIKVTGVKK